MTVLNVSDVTVFDACTDATSTADIRAALNVFLNTSLKSVEDLEELTTNSSKKRGVMKERLAWRNLELEEAQEARDCARRLIDRDDATAADYTTFIDAEKRLVKAEQNALDYMSKHEYSGKRHKEIVDGVMEYTENNYMDLLKARIAKRRWNNTYEDLNNITKFSQNTNFMGKIEAQRSTANKTQATELGEYNSFKDAKFTWRTRAVDGQSVYASEQSVKDRLDELLLSTRRHLIFKTTSSEQAQADRFEWQEIINNAQKSISGNPGHDGQLLSKEDAQMYEQCYLSIDRRHNPYEMQTYCDEMITLLGEEIQFQDQFVTTKRNGVRKIEMRELKRTAIDQHLMRWVLYNENDTSDVDAVASERARVTDIWDSLKGQGLSDSDVVNAFLEELNISRDERHRVVENYCDDEPNDMAAFIDGQLCDLQDQMAAFQDLAN